MAKGDLLQTLLNLHLSTDSAAVTYLPSVLFSLSPNDLESSPHLAKWSNRVNSLVRSSEPGARWAGITLALFTARLSRSLLISSAQGWVSVVLPMLSRNESPVVWKACIRLISFIFTSTTTLAEFQRHVVTPNVPKFSSALLSLAENQEEEELKVLCLDVLADLIPQFPSLHRQMVPAISTLSLNFLNGSHTLTPTAIISSASRLHACLHVTGGKVGAGSLWRKSVDEIITFSSTALDALRTTYAPEGQFAPSHADPLVSVPLNIDRLRCGVELLCHLLRAKVERPVPVPIQSLVILCVETLRVTREGASRDDYDASLRNMEAAAVPNILTLGCSLTACLAKCVQNRLAPHLSRILGVIVFQLEQPASLKDRIAITNIIPAVLGSCLPPHEPLLCGRIVKAVLPSIATLLSEKAAEEATSSVEAGSKKGKKRARVYEGDEVFNVGRSMLCETPEDAEIVLAALGALPCLLRVPNIPGYLQSLSSRVILSLLLLLPKLPARSVAHDPSTRDGILRKVKSICIEFVSGSSTVLCKSLPLVTHAATEDDASSENLMPDSSNQNAQLLDLILHPRLPPLLRPLPALDAIALWQSEESSEERKTRESLGLRGDTDNNIVSGGRQETTEPTLVHIVQQHPIRSDPDPVSRETVAEPRVLPTVIPTAALRAGPPIVHPLVATETDLPRSPNAVAKSTMAQRADTSQETERPSTPPGAERKGEMLRSVQHTESRDTQQSLPRVNEPPRIAVDDDEEDEDVEMPVVDPASPTDSEVE